MRSTRLAGRFFRQEKMFKDIETKIFTTKHRSIQNFKGQNVFIWDFIDASQPALCMHILTHIGVGWLVASIYEMSNKKSKGQLA